MPHYHRLGFIVNQPGFQIAGFNACPMCDSIELYKPTSALKTDSFGKPFTYITEDINNEWVEDGTFPTYGSWRCLTCNRSFRIPSFKPGTELFPDAIPAQSGISQAEF